MQGHPEFRSDHDPKIAGTATAPARPQPPLSKRIRAWTALSFLFLVIFGTAGGSILYARRISHSGRWDDLPVVLELMLPLGFVAWFLVRVRLNTGKWTESREKQMERAALYRARQTPAQMRARSLSRSVLTWAGYIAFEGAYSPWQRAMAWAILAGYGLVSLLFVALSVIAIGASCADNEAFVQRLLISGLGLLLLFLPVRNALTLWRRKRAGSLRITREEYAELQALRTAWRLQESKKPLRNKLATIAFAVATEIYLTLRVTVFHAHHRHESWVTPLFGLPTCVWVIWVQLRPPKQPGVPDTATETPAA